MSATESKKAIFYALAANGGIAVAKGITAIITLSGSMLAETIHSLADCINQLLLLWGMKRSEKPPDATHPLGYGKVTYFWSFIVAILLFSVGGLFSIYEGIHKLQSKEPLQMVWVALLVLAIAIVMEGFSFIGALQQVKKLQKGRSLMKWLKETRNSELLVILGEDTAALLGLAIAFVFIALADLLEMPALDAVGSICIGAILLVVSILLILRMKSLIIGKSAAPDIRKLIRQEISRDESVSGVFNVITMQIGPYIMLAGKIRIKSGISIERACEGINRLERSLKTEFPEIRWSFIEPDIDD